MENIAICSLTIFMLFSTGFIIVLAKQVARLKKAESVYREQILTAKKELDAEKASKKDRQRWDADRIKHYYGMKYEIFVGKHFMNCSKYNHGKPNYEIYLNGILKGKKDEGIDIIATHKDETLLIQCKYWTQGDKITINEAHKFNSNCYNYIRKYKLDDSKTRCILAITSKTKVEQNAYKFFEENSPRLRFEIIPRIRRKK